MDYPLPEVRHAKKDSTINAAVELHDSKITSIVDSDYTVVVELHAYIHQSLGRPGVDQGTGWTQKVRLTFCNATARSNLETIPDTILDGSLTLSDTLFVNVFSVPLTHTGPTCMHFEFANETNLEIRGNRFHAERIGKPMFVEPFDP